MKKEVSPELYNYNKFPGPAFALVGDKVVSETIELTLVDNYKNAFDQTSFGQRFSHFMLKFDYIAGDWGSEQLRLKGFYKDDKPVAESVKISRLDDYLREFCSFGCAYFVLENNQPQELLPELEEKPRRKRNRSRNPRRKAKATFPIKEQTQQAQEKRVSVAAFKKRQKRDSETKKSPDKSPTPKKETTAKKGFVIRQKKDY